MYRVMIVDDEYNIRDGIEHALPWGSIGAQVVGTARDGAEALASMEALGPDIVITDVRMDRMDGLTLGEQMLKHWPEVKLIYISGYDDPGYIRKSLNLRAFAYLLKPIRGKELLETTLHLIEQIQEERAARDKIAWMEAELARGFFEGAGTPSAGFLYPAEKEDRLLRGALDGEETPALTRWARELFDAMAAQNCDVARMYMELIGLLGIFSRRARAQGVDVYALFGGDLPDPFQAYRLSAMGAPDPRRVLEEWFLKILLKTRDALGQARPNHAQALIARANRYMAQHYCRYEFSLERTADALGLNPSYLSRLYKRETPTSFTEALTRLRLRKAQALLQDTDKKIAEVARLVGYPSDKYFCTLFKKYFGLAPSECRENMKV
jgi:two-component system response regulator YesN